MGLVTDIFSLEDFKKSIPFTALGARTCYSGGDLNTLLADPRVISKSERAKFLSKLGNYKHFSVFAHSFAYKDLIELSEEKINSHLEPEYLSLPHVVKAQILAMKIASLYFKVHYNPKKPTVIGISLRHYLEELLSIDEKKYFETFEKMTQYDVPVEPLGKKRNVTLVGLLEEYDGYAVFYIDDVSRVMTHQLVRHTTLNFSQRSQRYVKEDENKIIIPPSVKESDTSLPMDEVSDMLKIIASLKKYIEKTQIKESLKTNALKRIDDFLERFSKKDNLSLQELFLATDEFCDVVYEFSVYVGKVKREDGRFILPHGRKTTIVVSSTLNWIIDFIIKRTDPHAQWEIRDIAFQMKELLEEQGITVY
ncbi:MAG: FAD-dependent thymidylate synthase [Aquificae bacterium]|nr:FAD-dependent thymidylate synthase [Aquificota bacterium]